MSIRIPLILTLTGTLALAGCVSTPQDGSDPNRTRDGAIVGGILGAAAGLATGNDAEERRRNAAAGAILGAGAGAAIGSALDRQEAALRRQIGDERIVITNTGSALIVTMPQDILFATDSAALRPALQSDLRALAGNLQQYPDTSVDVIGHTDNTGSADYNQSLSARRAQSVASVLVSAGVSPARIRAIGRGEDAPVATNLTPEGRAQNRRVDIVIRPNA